jgi:DeoR/GlpR family transcriptional regulator of sugar metabolism
MLKQRSDPVRIDDAKDRIDDARDIVRRLKSRYGLIATAGDAEAALKSLGSIVTLSPRGLVLSPLLMSADRSTFYSARSRLSPASKRLVAMHIYQNVLEELDSLFMDAGSANGAIADEMTYGKKQHFTVLTNNVRAVRMFLANRTIRTLVTGGGYDVEEEALVGRRAIFKWQDFGCKTAFVGASAISTDFVYNHALTGEELIKTYYWRIPADHLVVPASILKFGGQDSSRFGRLLRQAGECNSVSPVSDEGDLDDAFMGGLNDTGESVGPDHVPGFRAKQCTIVIEPEWMIDEYYGRNLGENELARLKGVVRTIRDRWARTNVNVVNALTTRKELSDAYPSLAKSLDHD